jgi:hypothetical protein
MSGRFWLAQANIARMRASIDDPIMSSFVAQLEEVNGVADKSPGFIWRLQTEDGDATALRVFDDDRILFNMSVWDSIEALRRYVYQGRHASSLRDRRQWFEHVEAPVLVLWWIPEGHVPTVQEARERLELLERSGPTRDAFTFKQPFRPEGGSEPVEIDAAFCEWDA